MSGFDCDVLVVGLGPAGDVLAGLAKLQGLNVIAIDRDKTVYPLPRAAVFDHEVMRVFQALGMADRIRGLCRINDRYQFLTTQGDVLLDFLPDQQGPFGWAEAYLLHQPAVEGALREQLSELGVEVRLETRFVALAQDADGVDVSVEGPAGPESIRARYVVGCDGAASPVREALGIALDDLRFDEPWLVIDAIIEDPQDLPIACRQICDPERPVTYIAMSGQRFRWEFMLRPGETAEQILDDRMIRKLVEPYGCADRMIIERKAVYRFHGLVAERWQSGRVFLAGDAAHQMPPFAGQGMCSGIRDSANLAWKLAAVLRGEADATMLASYQIEREPHVRAIIATAIAMGKVVCMLDPVAAAHRDAEMLARKRSGAQDVSVRYPDLVGGVLTGLPMAGSIFPQPVAPDGVRLDDVLGIGPVLISRVQTTGDLGCVRAMDIASEALQPFASAVEAWLEAAGAESVLIRPDRHVFGAGEAADLLAQWRAMTQTPVAA